MQGVRELHDVDFLVQLFTSVQPIAIFPRSYASVERQNHVDAIGTARHPIQWRDVQRRQRFDAQRHGIRRQCVARVQHIAPQFSSVPIIRHVRNLELVFALISGIRRFFHPILPVRIKDVQPVSHVTARCFQHYRMRRRLTDGIDTRPFGKDFRNTVDLDPAGRHGFLVTGVTDVAIVESGIARTHLDGQGVRLGFLQGTHGVLLIGTVVPFVFRQHARIGVQTQYRIIDAVGTELYQSARHIVSDRLGNVDLHGMIVLFLLIGTSIVIPNGVTLLKPIPERSDRTVFIR